MTAMSNDANDARVDRIAAWRSMLIAHSRAVRAIEADLAAAGAIPLTWYDVLLEVDAAEEPLTLQELTRRVVLSRTRISRLVAELETRGYLIRSPDPEDGRSTRVSIGTAGKAALAQAAPVYMAGIDRHFNQHLSATQRRAIAAGLNRVIDAHDTVELQR
jgi:DNA-binding MarR family transcriptional regulator